MADRFTARAVAAWALILLAALAVPVIGSDAISSPAPALPMAIVCFLAGLWLAPRIGLFAVTLLAIEFQVVAGLAQVPKFHEFPNFEIAVFTFAPLWTGYELRRRRQLVERLKQRTAELAAAESGFVEMSVRRERLAIARELHDIVSHHLAVVVVQAGAGRTASRSDAATDRERFGTIANSGEQALIDLARLVDMMRTSSEEDGFARFQRLLAQASAGGLKISARPLPPDWEIPAAIESAAMDVVGESLTNAIKHAPGSNVEIRVERIADALEVEIHDDGGDGVKPLANTGAGVGTHGMRERVRAINGSLTSGATRKGWRVHARLPLAVSTPTE